MVLGEGGWDWCMVWGWCWEGKAGIGAAVLVSFWEGGAVGVMLGGWGWDGCTVWGWCWGKVGLGWVHSVGVVLGDSGAGLGAQCGALPFCPY